MDIDYFIKNIRAELANDLLQELQNSTDGMSEYELLKKLANIGYSQFSTKAWSGNVSMFRSHFLLFHTLYWLRDQLHLVKRGNLIISALQIRWQSYQAELTGIQPYDKLRAYYLDLKHYTDTDENALDEMLNKFWLQFVRNDNRAAALDVLGLQDPVDNDTIKQTYRKLVMQHHPDRGGDLEMIQNLNAAIEQLN